MELTDSIQKAKGLGKARAAALEKIGVATIADLLTYYPRDYDDRSNVITVEAACNEYYYNARVTVRVRLSAPNVTTLKKSTVTKFSAMDATGVFSAEWYNRPFLKNAIKSSSYYLLTGQIKRYGGDYIMLNPEFEEDKGIPLLSSQRIVPIYTVTDGISHKMLRAAIFSALDAADRFVDYLDDSTIEQFRLSRINEAIRNIHFPESGEAFFAARRRLVFDELFLMQLALRRVKGHIKTDTDIVIGNLDYSDLTDGLPYKPTNAQNRVLREILADMGSGRVMNRLLQGDVGCGKTLVSQIVAYLVIRAGYQAALMAPTEVLAAQLYQSYCQMFEPFGIKVVLLSGKLKVGEKRAIRAQIASGEARMVIGTHAVIQKSVEFQNLGLVITDEQHRFGVAQRSALTQKAQNPHNLIMSATPIPRSLGLVLYGDLDISVIDELPPGRQKIETYAVTSKYRQRLCAFIDKEVKEGRQVYCVCPLIEDSEKMDAKSVAAYTAQLREMLPHLSIAGLNGRMKADEKNQIMQDFASGNTDVLVSTTVIEVGVNVPNASLMIIENAERFGLSQLHQLRGRVGRGSAKSYCILVTDAHSDNTLERMKVMSGTNDGFVIAELDLNLRGYGDFFGTEQHGIPKMRIANLYRDIEILEQAGAFARELNHASLPIGIEREVNRMLERFHKQSI